MSHLFRRTPALILLAAIFVVSCEPVAPTPRPTWTPRATSTPEPGGTPTPFADNDSTTNQQAALNYNPDPVHAKTTDPLRVRAEPNTTADILGRLNQGDEILLYARTIDSKWFQTQLPNSAQRGWIASDYVVANGSIDSLLVLQGSTLVPPSSLALQTPIASAQLNPRPGAATDINPVVRTGVRDPLLPVFGPFPPVPVPSRPTNLNPLTGQIADPASLQHRPIVARIGNDQKAREQQWQAGLNAADLVFEELIDILGTQYANTRYSAVYLSNNPPLIGPIRSNRIISFQIAGMLDGMISNAGGSSGTRWLFSQTPLINLDEFFNMPAYCYEKNHGYQGRLYTTGPRLREYTAQKGWDRVVPLYGFNFSDSAPAGGLPINSIGLSQAPWPRWSTLQWKYDAASGSYLRFTTGAPHIDNSYSVTARWGNGADCIPSGAQTQTQVRANNVIVLYARHEKTNIIEDSNNAVSVKITLTGQGDAAFFRDGQMIKGKWQRKTEQEFFNFTDTAGNSYTFKPGNTWFEIVPLGYSIDIK